MNFTLGTLATILFLIPGYLFKRGYFFYPFSKKFTKTTPLDDISGLIFGAFFLHFTAYLLIIVILKQDIYLNSFLGIFQHIVNDGIIESTGEQTLAIDFQRFVLYTLMVWTGSYYIGFSGNRIVRKLKLDCIFRLFRFKNEFYYYFTGKMLDFPEVSGKSEDVQLLMLDVLTKVDDKLIIYKGACENYHLSIHGGLSSISLKGAHRKEFGVPNTKFIPIPSTVLNIPSETILNTNITYFQKKGLKAQKGTWKNMTGYDRALFIIEKAFDIITLMIIFYKLAEWTIKILGFVRGKKSDNG